MQLNLSTDYALRILFMLNGHDRGVSSLDISKHIGIERDFTLKILRLMKEGGFVKADRGKWGGYSLARPLDEITLFQVYDHMEDSMCVNRCLEPDRHCTQKKDPEKCPGFCFYSDFQKRIEEILGSTTVHDVLKGTYRI